MEPFLGKFVSNYLLLPLIGLLLGVVMLVIAQKNKLLNNKKFIFCLLLTCVVLTAPALLGFVDYWFMPYGYIGLALLYLLLGYYYVVILKKIMKDIKEKPYYIEFLCVFIVGAVSLCLFSLVFNLCNELQYGTWACTCMLPFFFPTVFAQAYKSYIDIPLEVYLIWAYDKETKEISDEDFDQDCILVVELELFKQVADAEPLNIKAKASDITPFGPWFKVFIDDYNKKSPLNPIAYSDNDNTYGWIFYTNTSLLSRKRYLDPGLSFAKNRIKEKNVIIAKRVQYAAFDNIEK